MESLVNIVIGFTIAFVSNSIFIPMATGEPLDAADNAWLSIVYTLISLARSYIIRRSFNGRSVWMAIRQRLGA